MVMFRVIHAPNDILTSFDLWAQIFRIDVEFAADYHSHTQKNFATKLKWYQRITLFANCESQYRMRKFQKQTLSNK